MINSLDLILRKLQNELIGVHPLSDELIKCLTRYYAHSWINARKEINNMRFSAEIKPSRIYWVDPACIEKTVSWTRISTNRKADQHPLFRKPKYRLAGKVIGGEWDLIQREFRSSTIYQSFTAHFKQDVPWEATDFYRESVAAIQKGATLWGCSSVEEFDQRCYNIDILFNRISNNGYKTQKELYSTDSVSPRSYPDKRVIWDEIAVCVGRNGEFLFIDGRNRLSIAKVLNIDYVPVVILVRHEEWQHFRDSLAQESVSISSINYKLRNHPDLSNLI